MGGDGQALTNKRTLLERSRAFAVHGDSARNKARATPASVLLTHCALSLAPLEAPVAFDLAGMLYSKHAVVEHLLAQRAAAAAVSRDGHTQDSERAGESLRKMSDVCEVHEDSIVVDDDDGGSVVLRCPLTRRVSSHAACAFVGLWSCGHVVSTSAQPGADDKDDDSEVECAVCGARSLIVRLALPDDAARATQRRRLLARLHARRKRARHTRDEV